MSGRAGLRRFLNAPPATTPGPSAAPQRQAREACELCATALRPGHGHLADKENATLVCACRACHLLFTGDGAGARFRAVPDRYAHDPARPLTLAEWDELQVPVNLAFFLTSTRAGRVCAFYPSPAGATECLLDLAAWQRLALAHPLLSAAAADTEAVLIHRGGAGMECFVVPIDVCYELTGRLRTLWRGFDGGQEARTAMDEFLAMARSRAVDLCPEP